MAPSTGCVVSPDAPAYHWNVLLAMSTAAVSVAVSPLTIDVLAGCSVKTAALQVRTLMVTVAVAAA